MALLNIIFGRKVRAQIGGITVDASIDEDHTLTCDVTENPVEDGANITDHVHLRPAELKINGVISDTPLDFSALNLPIVGNVVGLINNTLINAGEPRSIQQYNKLVELRKKREPFDVVTGLKVYKNMILSSLTVNRNATNGKAIHFSAEMKEIKIVKSSIGGDTTTLKSTVSSTVKDIASTTKTLGQKVTSALDPVRDLRLLSGASFILNTIRSLPLNA